MKNFAIAFCCAIGIAGCGSTSKQSDAPLDYAQMERGLDCVHYMAVFSSACRDADLGERPSAKYLKRLRVRASEIINTATEFPNDILDDGTRPAEQLHRMAERASCAPAIAKRLEIGARDSEDLRLR